MYHTRLLACIDGHSSDLECGKLYMVVCYANIHVPVTYVRMYIVAVQICGLVVCATWLRVGTCTYKYDITVSILSEHNPRPQHLSKHVYLNTATILLVETDWCSS